MRFQKHIGMGALLQPFWRIVSQNYLALPSGRPNQEGTEKGIWGWGILELLGSAATKV